jgi:hypothetical protein
MPSRREFLLLSALSAAGACATPRRRPLPPAERLDEPAALGDSIVACGERFRIDAPVVLWSDPGGYDAYSTELRFPASPPAEPPQGLRYAPGRKRPDGTGATRADGLAALRGVVDQFVVHFDVCGTSRTCFQVLQDRRKLSVHFLLDIDGTIYQTLDLAETAWHARQANPRSVGVELAHIGAYPPGDASALEEWYVVDDRGARAVRLHPPAVPLAGAARGRCRPRLPAHRARRAAHRLRPARRGGPPRGALRRGVPRLPRDPRTLARQP